MTKNDDDKHLILVPISPQLGLGLGLGWVWARSGAELSNYLKGLIHGLTLVWIHRDRVLSDAFLTSVYGSFTGDQLTDPLPVSKLQ